MKIITRDVDRNPDGRLSGLKVGMLVFNSLRPDIRVWKEASTLAAEGATVDIFALQGPEYEGDEYPFDGVTVHRITRHVPSLRMPLKLLQAGIAFTNATQSCRCEVWHAHDGRDPAMGGACGSSSTCPSSV